MVDMNASGPLHQGLSLKEKEYWGSSRNFVKCTGQQIKQPEAGCSLLETRFATSSKNHAELLEYFER